MTSERDLDRAVRSWLDEGVTALPDRVLDDVLSRLPETPQRRTWRLSWRPRMNSSLRIVLPFASILVAVVAGATLLPAVVPVATGPSSAPSPTPSLGEAVPRLRTQLGEIKPGTYGVSAFKADVRITVPDGWALFQDGAGFSAIVDDPSVRPGFRAVAFWDVGGTYADPCRGRNSQPSTSIGPSVDDLVAALTSIPHTTASTPLTTSIGGRSATKFQIFLPRELPCPPDDFYLWSDRYAQGAGERDNIWILEVDGERLLILAEWLPGVTEDDLLELQDMVGSIKIEPAGD